MIQEIEKQVKPDSRKENIPTVLHARVVSETGGGPEKTILNSPRLLETHGYRGVCAYMHPPNDAGFEQIRHRADECGAPLVDCEDSGITDTRVFRWLLDVCREQRVSIFHAHDYKSNLFGLLLRRYWPMQLVTTVHGWVKFTWKTRLYFAIDRLCLRGYDKVICVSDDLLKRSVKAGVPVDRCIVLDNAIDLDQYQRTLSRDAAKQQLGFSSDRVLIGAVGRLSSEKSFDSLIHAADRLIDDGLDVELVIVGDGDQRDALQSLINRLGRNDRIRLLGYRSDMKDIFQAFDVFALSSLREGLPNVVLEAMASGVPVVANPVGGMANLIDDGRTGFLADPNNENSMAVCLARLVVDDAIRRTIGVAGRDVVESRYSFAKRMAQMCNIYDDVLVQQNKKMQA